MKFIFKYILLIIFIFFAFCTISHADKINSIKMDIYIDENGNAHIKEERDVDLWQGTEGYKSFNNIGNANISDFKVSDSSGTEYQFVDDWNVNDSFIQKAYKYGFNYTENGIELCWGISQYGNNVQYIEYTINGFIKQYTDKQGTYFKLLNFNMETEKFEIKIHSYIPLDLSNSRIWAFGYVGTDIFEDGNIVLTNDLTLYNGNYVTLLASFQDDLFNTSNVVNKSFDEDFDEAMADVYGESPNIEDYKDKKSVIVIILKALFCILCVGAPTLGFAYSIYESIKESRLRKHSFKNMTIPKEKNVAYYRDIPCNGDLDLAYWICYHYKFLDLDDLRKNIIGAYFTKWIKEGKLKIVKKNENDLDTNLDKFSFDIKSLVPNDIESETEKYLANLLVRSSQESNLIHDKDFYKWSKKNFEDYNYWYKRILTKVENQLVKQGNLYASTPKKAINNIYDKLTDTVNEHASNVLGFKKFIQDFGNIPDKVMFDIHLFEDYLVFASLLGVAQKLDHQFRKKYPDYKTRYDVNYDDLVVIVDSYYVSFKASYDKKYPSSKSNHNGSSGSSWSSSSHDYSGSSNYSGGGGSSFSSGGSSAGGSSGDGYR